MNLNVNQLKIKYETSKNLIALCPFHDDKNNANLHITKVGRWKGYFKCFACGVKGKIDPKEVDAISKKKTVRRNPILTDWDNLVIKYNVKWACMPDNCKPFDISDDVLAMYATGWDSKAFTFPMCDEKRKIIGIHRRFPNGHKCCVEGSQLGLFIPYLPIIQVIICEGLSDAAVATELGYWGLGKPSASFGDDIILKFLTIHKVNTLITIIADNDEIGRVKSEELQEKLLTSGISCVIIYIEKYKDLREYYLNEGREKTVKLLRE